MGNPAHRPGPSKQKGSQAWHDSWAPGTSLGALCYVFLILVTLFIASGLCQTSQEDKDALLMFQGGISDDQVSCVSRRGDHCFWLGIQLSLNTCSRDPRVNVTQHLEDRRPR